MSVDLEELKRLAQAATPGPWQSKHHGVFAEGTDVCRVSLTTGHYESEEKNRDFIAAANPAAVLALVERVERAEAALKGLHTDVSAALAEAERQSTGTHGMSVPYTGPFASGLRLPSVVRDLREQQRVISAALEGAK